jgi:hypothetical protein
VLHDPQAHPTAPGARRSAPHPDAVVGDCQEEVIVVADEADPDLRRAAVAGRVARRLLGDPEQLGGGRHRRLRAAEVDFRAARDAVEGKDRAGQVVEGARDPVSLERDRMERAGALLALAEGALEQLADLLERRSVDRSRALRAGAVGQRTDEERQAGEVLTQSVVKIAPQPPPFVADGGDHLALERPLLGDVADEDEHVVEAGEGDPGLVAPLAVAAGERELEALRKLALAGAGNRSLDLAGRGRREEGIERAALGWPGQRRQVAVRGYVDEPTDPPAIELEDDVRDCLEQRGLRARERAGAGELSSTASAPSASS